MIILLTILNHWSIMNSTNRCVSANGKGKIPMAKMFAKPLKFPLFRSLIEFGIKMAVPNQMIFAARAQLI